MKRTVWILALLLGSSLGFNAYCYWCNRQMQTIVTLMDQKDKLQQQNVNDLIMIGIKKTNDNLVEVAWQQGKIEGMLSVITNQKPSNYEANQLWHAGYYRGMEQAKDMKKSLGDEAIPVAEKK